MIGTCLRFSFYCSQCVAFPVENIKKVPRGKWSFSESSLLVVSLKLKLPEGHQASRKFESERSELWRQRGGLFNDSQLLGKLWHQMVSFTFPHTYANIYVHAFTFFYNVLANMYAYIWLRFYYIWLNYNVCVYILYMYIWFRFKRLLFVGLYMDFIVPS